MSGNAAQPAEDRVDTQPVAEETQPVAEETQPATRRKGLTPRQAFGALAVVLGLALIALIIYLLLALRPDTFTLRGGEPAAGLKPVFVIEGPGRGKAPKFDRPMGAAFGPDGRIYVSDTGNNRVCVFDEDGEFLFEFGGFGVGKPFPGIEATWKPGRMNFPVGIDVDEDGRVYVADFRNDQIQVFDSEGEFIRAFPDRLKPVGKGSSGQDGGGIAVTDVAVRDGKVYATDVFQVFVFDTKGRLLRQFGKPGGGAGDLDHPNGIAVDADGTIRVSDSNHNRVTAFEADGDVLWNAGSATGPAAGGETTASADSEKTALGLPRGLVVRDDGSVLVADAFDFSLVHVSADGEILGRYGERGIKPAQMNFPNDVDADGSLLLVADKENNRVQVVELVGGTQP